MAQLWGGRFVGETDKLAYKFNASIGFDKRLVEEDIQGSTAHVFMLAKQQILTEEERDSILQGLREIREEVKAGVLEIDDTYEDIHSFVEAVLIKKVGEVGKKLHTGRSRNDQVALDMRLYTRRRVRDTDALLKELLTVILAVMEENLETYMPGFTHLQKAQPTTLAHHYGAYFEMFKRDRQRMADIYQRMNYCPLGAGALAGTTYPLDRECTASMMGFAGPTLNSMDSVSDRDYLIEFLSALSTVMMHLSRFCEEIIIWNSNEYQFVEIDDAYSTGSSIMPQKKNPDIAELVRGKTGRVYGALLSLLTTMKGIPLAYNKDMQEDKELSFDATDAADYLVGKGVPFRDAHGIVGKLVLYCVEKDTSIEKLSLEELQSVSEYFGEDLYKAVSLKTCVEKRLTLGAPGPDAMKHVIEVHRTYLAGDDFGGMFEKSVLQNE